MTYFTEKNHNIWDRGKTRGKFLLAKIVECYISCSINLYGCIGNIHCRNNFQLRLFLSGWEIRILLFSWNSVSKMTAVSNSASQLSKSMANPLSNPAGNVAPRWFYLSILVEMTNKTLHGLRASQHHQEIRGIFNGDVQFQNYHKILNTNLTTSRLCGILYQGNFIVYWNVAQVSSSSLVSLELRPPPQPQSPT